MRHISPINKRVSNLKDAKCVMGNIVFGHVKFSKEFSFSLHVGEAGR